MLSVFLFFLGVSLGSILGIIICTRSITSIYKKIKELEELKKEEENANNDN